jgi:hypothetical protein
MRPVKIATGRKFYTIQERIQTAKARHENTLKLDFTHEEIYELCVALKVDRKRQRTPVLSDAIYGKVTGRKAQARHIRIPRRKPQ